MSNPDSLRRAFIGSIPEIVQESEIRAAVARYGTISTFHYNQSARGWALVTFDTPEEAAAAVMGMNDKILFSACQTPIVCRIANEKKSGQAVGGLQQARTSATTNPYMFGASAASQYASVLARQQQQQVYSAAGMAGSTMIPEQPVPPPVSQWLTYYTPEGHAYYYNILTKTTQWEKPAELSQPMMPMRPMNVALNQAQMMAVAGYGQQQRMMMMADPSGAEALGGKKFGPPGCNLFVFHIPSEWTHRDLYEHFKFHGKIVSARVKTGPEDAARNLGFGFISYETPEATFAAIKAMHGFHVGGKWLKVTLKKGEEHLLPPHLQLIYQKTQSRVIGGRLGSMESQTQQFVSHQDNQMLMGSNGQMMDHHTVIGGETTPQVITTPSQATTTPAAEAIAQIGPQPRSEQNEEHPPIEIKEQ